MKIIRVGTAQYKFNSMCHIRELVFDTCMVVTLLTGTDVWGGSISSRSWNDIVKIEKKILHHDLGLTSAILYSLAI